MGAVLVLAAFIGGPAHAAFTAGISGTTLTITGDAASDHLALRLRSGVPNNLQVDVGDNGSAEFTFDRTLFDHIVVNAGSGDDVVRIDQVNGAFTDTEATTLNGGKGLDTLTGGLGAETLIGGPGADLIDGNQGNDVALMGTGADTFKWDPGDGSDTVEGQDDTDTMRFNGANIAEHIDISPNGGRLRFTRDIASIVMDTDGVEKVLFNALGGADVVTVHDLTGTDVTGVTADLAAPAGSGTGDGAADSVTVEGTAGPDAVSLVPGTGSLTVSGLAALVTEVGGELANDSVNVNTLAGNDQVSSSPLGPLPVRVNVDGGTEADTYRADGTNAVDTFSVTANGLAAFTSADGATGVNAITENVTLNLLESNDQTSAVGNLAAITHLTIDGGKGADTIGGSNGADTILGGDGNDFIDGNQGNDVALMGTGTDTFNWDPGDSNDIVEGQDGTDTLRFNGANIAEHIDISANGGRLRFTRDIASVFMDTDDVEKVLFNALGGADVITVHDLTGTDVTGVTADLALPAGSGTGDGAADQVVVEGTAGPDAVALAPVAGGFNVTGLFSTVSVLGGELANDSVNVNTLAGNDQISRPTPLVTQPVQVNVDGGTETDTYTAIGTSAADNFAVTANGAAAFVSDLSTGTGSVNAIVENVVLNTMEGNDQSSATGNLALITKLTIDGGKGADTLRGGNGADTIIGGSGNDLIDGNQGDDVAFEGTGTDTFNWDPGDGNDIVEGQDGTDTLRFNGANIAEHIDISANGGRLRFTRDIASIVMDTDDVEKVLFNALGGADVITVHDLTGTDVTGVTADLAAPAGSGTGDGAADQVVVEGTNGVDSIDVAGGSAGGVTVSGLTAVVRILTPEFANDRLDVNTLGGADTVDSGGLALNTIQLFVDGVPQ